MKVFISYAHQDKEKAFYLKERLKKNGFEVLGDFNLKIGENFKSVLDAELLKADAVVMLITEHYIASQFASREAATAYAYNEAVILSILVDTFSSRISLTMPLIPKFHNTACVLS